MVTAFNFIMFAQGFRNLICFYRGNNFQVSVFN